MRVEVYYRPVARRWFVWTKPYWFTLELPELIGIGATREEALEDAQDKIDKQLVPTKERTDVEILDL